MSNPSCAVILKVKMIQKMHCSVFSQCERVPFGEKQCGNEKHDTVFDLIFTEIKYDIERHYNGRD